MNREEIEAMWERIKALEENQLKIGKAVAYESLLSTYNLAAIIIGLANKKLAYEEYMKPKQVQAEQAILSAESIDEIIELLRNFNFDCISFTRSLRK